MKTAIKSILYIALYIALLVLVDKITLLLFGRSLSFVIIILAVLGYCGYAYFYTRRSLSTERLADTQFNEPNTPIPAKLQAYNEEILSLGFQLEKEHSTPNPNPLSSARQIIWLYVNPERTIVAWLHRLPRIDFDSYFADGFSTSTQYPRGQSVENEMVQNNIVATSITAAYDYHLHACDMLIAEHGELLSIADWELVKQRQYPVANAYRQYVKKSFKSGIMSLSKYALVFVVLLILPPIYMAFFYDNVENNVAMHPLWTIFFVGLGLVILSSPLILFVWMVWKFIHSINSPQNTVEARKAKKREMSS